MRILFGGKFESAVLRSFDEINRPTRNTTTHGYYMNLNRKLPKRYFDRCATFLSMATEILIPELDWLVLPSDSKVTPEQFSFSFIEDGGREWDDETQTLNKILLRNNALSDGSRTYIRKLDISDLLIHDKNKFYQNYDKTISSIENHYMSRLFLQIRAASETGAYLVVSEEDFNIIVELGRWFKDNRLVLPFDFPDLSQQLIDGENFVGGLLNFAPPDVLSLVPVRQDRDIREYSQRVSSILRSQKIDKFEKSLLDAMVLTYKKAEHYRKIEKVFEFSSWAAKPLNYVPIIGEVLSVASDVSDIFLKWNERKQKDTEWYLLSTKMSDISISDYLKRKSNLI